MRPNLPLRVRDGKSKFSLLIQTGSGSPLSLRLDLRKIYALLGVIGGLYVLTIVGSLLFFREVEINRKLEEHVLDLEMRDRLSRMLPAVAEAPNRPLAAEATTETAEITPTQSASSGVKARLAEINATCVSGRCGVKLEIVPVGTGVVEGQLLIILETEIPRIGTVNPTTQIRKRFFIYPGGTSRDELDQADIIGLQRRSFHFSHALQTSAEFKVGNLLRPIAINVYLYDLSRNLIQQERKVIETGE